MKRYVVVLFAIISVNAGAQIPFEARVDSIRAGFLSNTNLGSEYYAEATAKILSKTERTEGFEMMRKLLYGATTEVVNRFRMTEAYMYTRNVLPDSIVKLVRSVWAYVPVEPLRLEHDKVMYYTALLLSAERFGNEQRWFNHRSTQENIADAKSFLNHWIKETSEQGQQEFDSPTYGAFFIASMLLLREYGNDAPLHTRADLMAQWLLADFAHEYIGGYYAGAHSNEDQFSTMQPVDADISGLGWLYFGDGPQLYTRGEQFFAALSSFRPNKAIVAMATERIHPYIAREMKRSADRVRGDTARTRPVPKYTYMTPLYAVGSMRGGLVSPFRQHTWDVTWPVDSGISTLYIMHPYGEQEGITEFFPHSQSLVYRYVSNTDPFYGNLSKAVGGSPFEDVFQHKNTLIALYDIPDIERYPFISGFLPAGTKGFEIDSLKSGWITFNEGEVYLAVYPMKKYSIMPASLGKRLFSRNRKNGVIVQVAGMPEVPSYEEFVRKVRASKINMKDFEKKGKVRYTTIFGDKLEFTYHGDGLLNGKKQRNNPAKLFDSPWIQCDRGTGVMKITSEKGNCVIDLIHQTIQ